MLQIPQLKTLISYLMLQITQLNKLISYLMLKITQLDTLISYLMLLITEHTYLISHITGNSTKRTYLILQITQLNTLITLLLGDLTNEDRQKIMTICTIDVHSRDVVAKIISAKIENASVFQWQSQLRHRYCFVLFCVHCGSTSDWISMSDWVFVFVLVALSAFGLKDLQTFFMRC